MPGCYNTTNMAFRHVLTACLLALTPSLISGLHFLVIGDWGDDSTDQYNVANDMDIWCGSSYGPCDFIVDVGDNFYERGVLEPNSTRFQITWKNVYNMSNIRDLVWYIQTGNHDYSIAGDREMNQVEYAKTDPQWYMPWIYYNFSTTTGDGGTVDFISFDTQALILHKHDSENQTAFIQQQLAASTADWKFIFGHYPAFTCANHAPGNLQVRTEIVPLCNEYNVDVFFAGHDHDLELMQSANYTDYIVSGAGGKSTYEFSPMGEEILNSWGVNVTYFGEHFGFVAVDVSKSSMTAYFVDTDTHMIRYSYTRNK